MDREAFPVAVQAEASEIRWSDAIKNLLNGADIKTIVALYVLGALANVAVSLIVAGPLSADASFYGAAASSIAHGHLDVDFLWSFNEVGARIPADPHLPIPIGGHWLPGAAFIAAPFVLLFGSGWPIAALGPALVGGLAAPVAWRLARDLGLSQRLALGAGVCVAIGGPLLPFLGQPDTHAVSAGLGALVLLLCGRAAIGSKGSLVLGALLIGGMILVRNDGLLYVVPLAAAVWLGRKRLSLRSIAIAIVAFGAVVGPWWLHQEIVFGSISPSASAGRSLWILNLDDFNRIGPLTFNDFLANGAPAIVASRVNGLVSAVVLELFYFCAAGVLLPFALYALAKFRSKTTIGPTLLFGAAFFASAVLVFPAHIANGMFLRSGASLWPLTVALAFAGIDHFVTKMASPPRARGIVGAIIGAVIVVQLGLAGLATANEASQARANASTWLWVKGELQSIAQPTDILLTYDAATAFWYTGYPAVSTPNDPQATIETVAIAYQTRWLVVIRGQTLTATAPLLDGGRLPWVGDPAAQLVEDGHVDAAIFPVEPTSAVVGATRAAGADGQ